MDALAQGGDDMRRDLPGDRAPTGWLRRSRPALWLAALLLAACGSRSGTLDSAPAGDRAAPGACSCAPTVSGTLHGSAVTFDHAAYGVQVTWGTHAHPVSPEAAVGLVLQLSEAAIDCADSKLSSSGPHVIGIDLQTARQELQYGWVEPTSGPSSSFISGELCFAALPVQDGEPVGYPAKVSEVARGCLKLRFTDYDATQQHGEASGGFVASHCPPLDSALGE